MNDLDRAIIDYLTRRPAGVCTNWLAHGVNGPGPAAFAQVLDSLVARRLIRDDRPHGSRQPPLWKVVG